MGLLSSYTIRRCIIADPGHVILSADFDQIELRIAAALAREQSLMDAARRGESLHKIAAVALFGEGYTPDQYRTTKAGNFGWLYGIGANKMAVQTGIPITEAAAFLKNYNNRFRAMNAFKRTWQNKVLASALNRAELAAYRRLQNRYFELRGDTKEGRAARNAVKIEIDRLCYHKIGFVTTEFGRRLPVEASKAYKAVNYIVQSSARDVLAAAMLDVMDDAELEPTVLLPIHDELLGQAPRHIAEEIAKRYGAVMSRNFHGVPLTATGKVYGRSWGHGYR